MTPEYQKARRHLSRRDAVLKDLIRRVGPCTLQPDRDGFRVLVRSIISQQISTKAAMSIGARLKESVGVIKPENILKASEETLQSVGLSGGKRKALRDLAGKCQSGEVPLKKLPKLPDEEVIELLVPVHGIGRWTAEMYLIFALGRSDILPVHDLGLRAGVRNNWSLAELPGRDELVELADPWRPYRSIATWFIWRSFGVVPQSKT